MQRTPGRELTNGHLQEEERQATQHQADQEGDEEGACVDTTKLLVKEIYELSIKDQTKT